MSSDAPRTPPVTVEHLLLCESVRYTPEGRPEFVGVISRGTVAGLPVTVDAFCISVELWGPPEARVPVKLRIHAPSGVQVREEDAGVIALDGEGTRSFGGTFDEVRFEEEGLHRVSIWTGDTMLGARRFLVEVEPETAGLTL